MEHNATTRTTNNINNHLILPSNEVQRATIITNVELDTNPLVNNGLVRLSSTDSNITDDEDKSLHILSDEQVSHLAAAYHSFPSESSPSTCAHDKSSK